jgi:hypothetical protein
MAPVKKCGRGVRKWALGSTTRLQGQDRPVVDDVRAKQHDLREQVEDVAARAVEKFSDQDTRNNLLLGVVGLAIAAAVGIACQKRISETAAE